MTPPSASQPETKHARQNTRVVPVIPRQLGRKNVDRNHKKETNGTDRKTETASVVNGAVTPSLTPNTDSATNVVNGMANGLSSSLASSVSDGVERTSPAAEEVLTAPSRPHSISDEGIQASQKVTETASATPQNPQSAAQHGETTQLAVVEPANTAKTDISPEKSSASTKSPVDLPPPFYPTAQAAFVGRNTSDSRDNRRSFVFGGAVDSSAPSPVPPLSAGSWNSSSAAGPPTDGMISPAPPQINGFGRSGPHINGSRTEPTNTSGLGSSVLPQQTAHHPQAMQPMTNGHHNHHHRPWHGSQQIQSPRSASIGSNPSETPFPSQYQYYPQGPSFPIYNGYATEAAMNMPRPLQYPSFPPPFHSPQPSGHFDPRAMANPEHDYYNTQALRDHIETALSTTDFADCIVRVPQGHNATKESLGHCVVLSRSPRLRRMLLQSTDIKLSSYHGRPYRTLEISPDAIYGDSNMFSLALRYLYGGSLIQRSHLQSSLASPKQAMRSILSYISVGWYLEIPEIATAGLVLVTEFLVPDNLEVALDFVLKKDTRPLPAVDGPALATNGDADPAPQPSKNFPYASDISNAIQRFMIFLVVGGFDLDPSAPELDTRPRIPASLRAHTGLFSHSSRMSVNNPKLQGITLGSFQAQSSSNRVLSSVFLSLPSSALQSLFADRVFHERMPPDAALGLVKSVVAERENRRLKAIETLNAMNDEHRRALDAEVMPLWNEEEVETMPAEQGLFRIVLRDTKG